MAQNFKELHRLAAEERRMLNDRISNVLRYDAVLNHREITPNGDDYNAVMAMLNGHKYTTPHREGR